MAKFLGLAIVRPWPWRCGLGFEDLDTSGLVNIPA